MRTGFATVPNIAGGAGSPASALSSMSDMYGKEHLLFFHQVNPQLLSERREDLLHLEEFRMILAVYPNHLGGQRQNARAFFPNESVVRGGDMTDQVRE